MTFSALVGVITVGALHLLHHVILINMSFTGNLVNIHSSLLVTCMVVPKLADYSNIAYEHGCIIEAGWCGQAAYCTIMSAKQPLMSIGKFCVGFCWQL